MMGWTTIAASEQRMKRLYDPETGVVPTGQFKKDLKLAKNNQPEILTILNYVSTGKSS